MEEFTNFYGVKTNSLEYKNICSKMMKFLEWKGMPSSNKPLTKNTMLNFLLNLGENRCSNLYIKWKGMPTYNEPLPKNSMLNFSLNTKKMFKTLCNNEGLL